ncbi:hypothetical protein GGR77_004107 [Xanthomonas translucens]
MQAWTQNLRNVLGWSLITLAIGLVLIAAYWCWILRDGLGPDAMMSTGYAAVVAAATGGWHLLVPGMIVGGGGILCLRRGAL